VLDTRRAISFPELPFDLVMKIVVETAFISPSSFKVTSHCTYLGDGLSASERNGLKEISL
jgi:hypothetical protein